MILLDTHVLVWLDQGSDKLGKNARYKIEQAFEADRLGVSAISFWELAMLRIKDRIDLPPLHRWRRELLEMGLKEIPIDGAVGIQAAELSNFHADPADRIIVATAIGLQAACVTTDQRILTWRGEMQRVDGSR
ncbi:MAG: type II toxin-antitoxin system VapC family toxin [Gammaproteobacteria bacterium]|nr:type II toxin-antitoxin system VapC family toxin [Gammaproteobacteria bacterium]